MALLGANQNSGTATNSEITVATKANNPETKLNFFEQFKLGSRIHSEAKPSLEELESRAADIRRMGSFLQKHPMPEMLKDYISQVRDLLGDLSDHAYAAHKDSDLFQKINVIDEKLDLLADKVLKEEQESFALAESLGELQGLLIDVFA